MNWLSPYAKELKKRNTSILLVLFCLLLQFDLSAQATQKIELIQADELVFTERLGIQAQRLLGNVIFKHQEALMYCDSAYLYKDINALDAFGNVRINQGDTLNLHGDVLNYDGNKQLAVVSGDTVRLINTNFTLTTDKLFYNRETNVADYFTGGLIESKTDSNVLVSEIGHFFANQQLFTFRHDVQLSNPNFIMNSDTLKYFTNTEMVNFLGPTTILGDSNLIYCETGWYDTRADQSTYYDNAYIITDGRKMIGDTIFYDRMIGFGQADGDIEIIDTAQQIIVSGQHAEVYELKDSVVIVGEPMLTQIIEEDSMFMHADTFKIFKTELGKQFMLAYYGVRIFKSDMQGKCDSISYSFSDSTIQLYEAPVLWSDSNQLTADRIDIRMANKKIHSIFLDQNAFVISEVDTLRYNQVKGKEMTGYFTDSKLSLIKVRGNGETTYFGQDDDNKFLGVNVAESTDIDIRLKDNAISTISFLNEPNAVMYPMGELDPVEELRYKGFQWLIKFRPRSKNDIFKVIE